MATLYFGFGVSDSMFPGDCTIKRKDLKGDGEYADYILRNPSSVWCKDLVVCLNPSHQGTIDAMANRYGIVGVEIPPTPINVSLEIGDVMLVMSPRGLPRLIDRHEYTQKEIDAATFNFAIWEIEETIND